MCFIMQIFRKYKYTKKKIINMVSINKELDVLLTIITEKIEDKKFEI